MAAAYLYHHDKDTGSNLSFIFLGDEKDYDPSVHSKDIPMRIVSEDEIKAYFPTKFSDKVDLSLLVLAKKSEYFGNTITISDEEMCSLLFIRRYDEKGEPLQKSQISTQYKSLLDYFEKQGYVEGRASANSTTIQLMAEGWKQIEKLQIADNQNKNVFVSMSFADRTKEIREAIRAGIVQAGFSPEFLDEIKHNRQIVPEMFRLIRECRFLVLEISEPNYGAYYEAGYAQGLGKEVIICCSKEVFNRRYITEEEKKYERYLKPHFDIAQKQILVWKDQDDLSHQLSEWIKAIIV